MAWQAEKTPELSVSMEHHFRAKFSRRGRNVGCPSPASQSLFSSVNLNPLCLPVYMGGGFSEPFPEGSYGPEVRKGYQSGQWLERVVTVLHTV